jgi:hypothetical protein
MVLLVVGLRSMPYPFGWVQHGSTWYNMAQKNEHLFDESRSINLHAKINALSDRVNQLIAAGFAKIHFSHTYIPYEPFSYCSNPYYCDSNCLSWV